MQDPGGTAAGSQGGPAGSEVFEEFYEAKEDDFYKLDQLNDIYDNITIKKYNIGQIDEIIKEPEIEENEGFEVVSQNLKDEILKAIKKYAKMKPEDIKEERYQKFRNMGEFQIL